MCLGCLADISRSIGVDTSSVVWGWEIPFEATRALGIRTQKACMKPLTHNAEQTNEGN